MEDHIDKKIHSTLNSINEIKRATAPPYFFARLEARMQRSRNFWDRSMQFFTNPVLAFGSICLLFLLNIYVISVSDPNQALNNAQNPSELSTIDEYNQVTSSLFDFENNKP